MVVVLGSVIRPFDDEHFDGGIGGDKFKAELIEHGLFERVLFRLALLALPFEVNVEPVGHSSLVKHRHLPFAFAMPGEIGQGYVVEGIPTATLTEAALSKTPPTPGTV